MHFLKDRAYLSTQKDSLTNKPPDTKVKSQSGNVAQQVKILAAKPDDLSSWVSTWWKERTDSHSYVYIHTHTLEKLKPQVLYSEKEVNTCFHYI